MYCAYRDCPNVSLPFSKISFFALPNDSRRDIWIENSGNGELKGLSAKTKKVFCEAHFAAKDMRKQFMRTTLRKDAVPLKYVSPHEDELPHNATTLTEILDDDVEDEIEMNAAISDTRQYDTIKPQHIAVATQKRKVDTERIKYVYVMNNKKLASIDKTDPMDYYGPTEIDEEDVELIVANDQNKIDLVDGEPLLEQLDDIEEEIAVPTKRRRSDDGREIAKSPAPVTQPDESSRVTQPTINHQPEDDSKTIATNRDEEVIEGPRSRANPIDSNDEETLFALSLVGTLKRLPPPKLAAAKCHILTYLMQLEYGDASTKFS